VDPVGQKALICRRSEVGRGGGFCADVDTSPGPSAANTDQPRNPHTVTDLGGPARTRGHWPRPPGTARARRPGRPYVVGGSGPAWGAPDPRTPQPLRGLGEMCGGAQAASLTSRPAANQNKAPANEAASSIRSVKACRFLGLVTLRQVAVPWVQKVKVRP
jgi:hypothetical protein